MSEKRDVSYQSTFVSIRQPSAKQRVVQNTAECCMQVVLSSRVEKVAGRGLNQWIRQLSHKLNRFIQNVESAQRAAAILRPVIPDPPSPWKDLAEVHVPNCPAETHQFPLAVEKQHCCNECHQYLKICVEICVSGAK